MARTAWDCAALLAVMAGHDPRDPDVADKPLQDYTATLSGGFGTQTAVCGLHGGNDGSLP